MAELLGTFSAALGIVGVAGQTVEVVQKVARFVRDVQDVPEDIKNMASELQILATSLSGIELQIQQTSPVAFSDPSPALLYFRQGIHQISELLTQLESDIQKRRKRGSVKAVWKKDEIEKHWRRIERAKNTLSLAYQLYSSEKTFSRMDRLDAALDESIQLTTTDHHAVTSLVVSQKQQQLVQHTPSAPNRFSTDLSSSATSANNDGNVEDTIVSYAVRHMKPAVSTHQRKSRLGLPYWMVSQTLEIIGEQAVQGWDFKIRTYRTVSSDSAIFKACQYADLPLVRQLIASGQASALDRTPDGWTPLHYLMDNVYDHLSERQQPEVGHVVSILGLLLDSGADLATIDFSFHQSPPDTCRNRMLWTWQNYTPEPDRPGKA